ncbi:hypothetical protein RU94_GL001026 [Enterococcus asini]|nr:hypothetical protein RU94_GL001026 [Enterococcus asini]
MEPPFSNKHSLTSDIENKMTAFDKRTFLGLQELSNLGKTGTLKQTKTLVK